MAIKLTESRLREYFETCIRLEAKLLIEYFIKEAILYDDKIDIIYKNILIYSPGHDYGSGLFLLFKGNTLHL